MPIPHFEIKITQRSKNQSAVAEAAYQSGDNLFCEYDQKRKNYNSKGGIVYTEIMLPGNAPPEFADRETLWNSVEGNEKQWNSQLARRFVLALPREVPAELYPQMVREYCQEHFVSKGMCCDFAIHDPDGAEKNPHCHILLTLRAMDEHGKWLPKSRKVYDLDENGERIRLPSGCWKSHKENTVDWNEQYHAEEWRHGWEVIQNRYLEMTGRPERVDLRSYARQGLDIVPTVHMGPAVTQMERRGVQTNIGNLNREIRKVNSMMAAIRKGLAILREWIDELKKEIQQAAEAEASPDVVHLLTEWMDLRQAERRDWSQFGKSKASTADLKKVTSANVYLHQHNIFTLEDLDAALQGLNDKAHSLRSQMKKSESRMKVITGIQKAVADCMAYKDVHDKYRKIGWKTRQQLFADAHKDELAAFNKAYHYLKKQGADPDVDLGALQAEYDSLMQSHSEQAEQLAQLQAELKPLKDVRYWVSKVLEPEPEVEQKPEPKHSVKEHLAYIEEQRKSAETTEQQQQKKQNRER